jgi:hypothetical protein
MIADLRAGKIIMGSNYKLPPEVTAPRQVTPEEIEAYESGAMDVEKRSRLSMAIEAGQAALPPGKKLTEPKQPWPKIGIFEAVLILAAIIIVALTRKWIGWALLAAGLAYLVFLAAASLPLSVAVLIGAIIIALAVRRSVD